MAAKTKQIHVGTAITPPPGEPSARVAERIATSTISLRPRRVRQRPRLLVEEGGLRIPAPPRPAMCAALEQSRASGRRPYAFEGKTSRCRPTCGRAYSKPHPPIWVACSSPQTFTEAGELGLGALCFTFGTPEQIAPLVKAYKDAIKRCQKPVGGYINDNIAVTTNMFCLPDGDEARALFCTAHRTSRSYFSARSPPAHAGFTRRRCPSCRRDSEGLRMSQGGGRQVGRRGDREVQEGRCHGGDQLTTRRSHDEDQKYVLPRRDLRQKILPLFDKDRSQTTRQRQPRSAGA